MAHVAAVSFACPACGKKFSAPAALAGRQLKCSGCLGVVKVPSPGGTAIVRAVPSHGAIASPRGSSAHPVGNQTSFGGGTGKVQPYQGGASGAAIVWRSLIWVGGVGIALAVILSLTFRDGVRVWIGRAARATASVVPAVEIVVRGRIVSPSEVGDVLSRVRLHDISSTNVYQQMVCYSRGTMEMSKLVAVALGADEDEANSVLRSAEVEEIGTRTVHQQKAVYFEGTFDLLTVAARGSGVSSLDIDSICSNTRLNDLGTDTVHQQCANYANGCLKMAALLAKREGAASGEVAAVISAASLADLRASNVYQQIVGRLTGFVEVLGIAAKARGATVDGIMSEMRTADIRADTVYQQEVGRLTAALKLLGLIATGG